MELLGCLLKFNLSVDDIDPFSRKEVTKDVENGYVLFIFIRAENVLNKIDN